CKLWGRIKDVPPGYMMLADWNPASSLKYKASMRAYKPRPAGSTTVASMGDVARVSISGYTSGEGQDASRTLFYNVNLNLTKNHSYTADFSSPNLQNLAYADLGIMPNGSDGNCPTVKHDFFFAFTGFSTGITPYSNGQAALPLDGFVHSFYITELPEIAFKLVKCN
ncbi:MAG TPA: hypothetical protein VE954_27525, partial [Oligoflexus sp.]|uniref:hypothetical protein n=1 Tax=Oligoflexus sp. TaxID=1971216 RepID=UPI002D6C8880